GVGTLFRSVAEQVDQILRGGKPGDIPVAFPQKFRLVINARAARALGLAISPSLRQRADEVFD
ncbi:MAG: ABC transporter substrate binding protein, partial [Solirubrobacteraceae bacterium]